MAKNVFVVAMDDFNLQTMKGLREARRYDFHSLIPTGDVLKAEEYDFDALLATGEAELRAFDGPVDGIVTWWDFPSSALVPILAERWDIPGPELRSILMLEHKYWSRICQRAVAADHVPAFAAFDPFADTALEQILERGVDFPFWIKPVKSVGSYLGFHIGGPDDWDPAITAMREEVNHFGGPFAQALSRVEMPHDVEAIGGVACLAEAIISGFQCTVEGYAAQGDVHVYGLVDSLREPGSSTFRSYQYPSQLPTPIQRRMEQISVDIIEYTGLDFSCFNIEFFYDEDQGHIWILEVNTRLSQSHCDLFAKVDGASSQRAMLGVSQGRKPRMLDHAGDFAVAGKYFLRAFEDGVVQAVPSEDDIAAVIERFPGTRVEIDPKPGTRLSEMAVQETYSYELGRVFIGGDDHDQLEERFSQIAEMLPFTIEVIAG
ncbi:MAG: acetyl-CoA carboxylase biotin carboxylase subunit family protein [Acidimicrobiales bacterium]